MKYTNYLINGTVFDFEKFISKKKYFKEASQAVIAPISIMALFGCMLALPFVVMYDVYRNMRYTYIVNTRDVHIIDDIKSSNNQLIESIKISSNFVKENIKNFHNMLN